MPPNDGESDEVYRYRLEATQRQHESWIKRTRNYARKAMSVALEAKEMSVDTRRLVESMPQRVIEAIEAEGSLKKATFREWLSAIGTIGSLIWAVVAFFYVLLMSGKIGP